MRIQECRRCQSQRLLILEKKREEDNDVYRCRNCGYLFSPPQTPAQTPLQTPLQTEEALSRGTAMESPAEGRRYGESRW